jgi:hypothetical protein
MLKETLLLPAVTVTASGATATASLLERETDTPPVGAAPVSVTVAFVDTPPATVAGESEMDESAAGRTVREARCEAEPAEAVIAAEVWVATDLVATVNEADVLPAAMVTLAGTVATLASPLARETTIPEAGAATVILTVPVEVLPPVTEAGDSVTEAIPAAAAGATATSALRTSTAANAAPRRLIGTNLSSELNPVR